MSSNKQITSPFYLQWQTNGNSNTGQWKISTGPDKNGKYTWSSLSSYNITAGSTYTIYFSGSHNGASASPYTVFAQVAGGTAPVDQGVKFSSASASTKAATLASYRANGSLTFSAAQLISGDPKIKLSAPNSKISPTATSAPPYSNCWLLWNGSTWYYSYTEPPTPSSSGSPYAEYNNDDELQLTTTATLYVTDTSSDVNDCAVYQGQTLTSSGQYYSGVSPNPQTVTQGTLRFTFNGNDNDQCTINMFQWRDSRSTLPTG